MKTETQNCQPDLLKLFLKSDLDREQDLQLTEHLESCEFCRQALESTAAEPDGWTEASRLLKPTQFDWNPDCQSDGSDFSNLAKPFPLQIRNVLHSLAPSEDPEMLGQLGGYQISGVVGAGAMGIVLKASDKSLDRTVAIKVLSPHLASSGAARKRFAREAKAAAAVLHANVIAIHGVSNNPEMPHLVMPYIRGTSLQKRIDDNGPMPVNEILRIAAQIAAGLAAAHAQGLVHRDIKPANILLEEGVERVAITDFGLARAVDDASLTRTGIIAGTPQYMSPEQSRGELVDQRSDLFSLGSVMFAMCTGRPPFRSETTYGVIQRINNDQPTPVCEINPDVPEWLARIIEKLMSKKVGDRFESAQEVSELLEQCLAHIQQPLIAPLPDSCVARSSSSRFFSGSRLRKGGIATMIILGLGLLGLAIWQGTAPPDITGTWYGDSWGEVELDHQALGRYEGVYSGTFGDRAGKIELEWSRIERRFNGTWQEGEDGSGEVSLRHSDDRIFGARTSQKESAVKPNRPKLSDFQWTREPNTGEKPVDQNAEAPEPLNAMDFSTVWVWSKYRHWKLEFKGDETWIEGGKFTWTETDRSKDRVCLHDEDRNMFGILHDSTFYYREDADEAWDLATGGWLRDDGKSSPFEATEFSTVWVRDELPEWKLEFQGDDIWIDGDGGNWTEIERSGELIYFHDKERNLLGMLYDNSFFYRKYSGGKWKLVSGHWFRDQPNAENDQSVKLDIDPTKPGRLTMHYCDADGTPIRPLLKDSELRRLLDVQGSPNVSADGKKVVFDAWSTVDHRWDKAQIVVCDIDGSNAHVICDGFMPTFSPDGKQFAITRDSRYTEVDGVKGGSIWIVNTDGSLKRMIADHGAWGVRWSSDGKSLVFYGGVDENGKSVPNNCLRLYDFETEEITNVFSPEDSPFRSLGCHFNWAKNKRMVAFSGIQKGTNYHVSATIDVDVGIDSLQLFDDPIVLHQFSYDFHPDGDSLLVTGQDDNDRTVPVSMAITDEGPVQILPNVPADVRVRDACYTPDGKHIIASMAWFGPVFTPEKKRNYDPWYPLHHVPPPKKTVPPVKKTPNDTGDLQNSKKSPFPRPLKSTNLRER